jgi:hypothetical protein
MDVDSDEKKSPLDNMNELHEWLTIWEKEVNKTSDKRTYDKRDTPIEKTVATGSRRRVSVPRKTSNEVYK